MTPAILALSAAAAVLMIAETMWSARNERALRSGGAIEPAGDVYRAMVFAYPAAFVAMIGEAVLRRAAADRWLAIGVAIFVAAKVLKYWAIASLGPRWTFRVLVPPGSTRTIRGPYRWLAHPNYVAVAGELTGVAVAAHALVSGPIAIVVFGYLMKRRIDVENLALLRGGH